MQKRSVSLQHPYPETNMTIYDGLFLYLSNKVNKPDWKQKVEDACSFHSILDKVFDTFCVRKIRKNKTEKQSKKQSKATEKQSKKQSKATEKQSVALTSNRFAALRL